jgi:hypothetical protein
VQKITGDVIGFEIDDRRTLFDILLIALFLVLLALWAVGAALCMWFGLALGWTEYWGRKGCSVEWSDSGRVEE